MTFREDDDDASPRQQQVVPPVTLFIPYEAVMQPPPAHPQRRGGEKQRRRRTETEPRQRRRSAWSMLFLSVGLLGICLSIMGLLITARAQSPTAPVASAQAPTTSTTAPLVTTTATTRPVAIFPPTPTIPVQTPTPVLDLPANLALPTLCPPPSSMTPTPDPSPTATATCVPCPYHFAGTAASHAQVKTVLDAAAATYHLPQNLVEGVAQLESSWNGQLISCSYDIGLMQVKYGYWQWIDELNVPSCDLQGTTYSPYILEQNALLGAKLLAYLTCYYSFAGDANGTLQHPGAGTVAYWYHQAKLAYPDAATDVNTPTTAGLCAGVFNDPAHPVYKALPATAQDRWSCPYTARTGDSTLLDVVIATYNQGIGTTNSQGIQNSWYVDAVEADIVRFGGT